MGFFSRPKQLPSVSVLPPLPPKHFHADHPAAEQHHPAAATRHPSADLDEKATSAFYCADGSAYNTLREFSEALMHMSEDTFSHHVNAEKNDFANWVEGCFTKNKTLAEAMRGKGREDLLRFFLALASRPEPLPVSPVEKQLEHRAEEVIRLLEDLRNLDRLEAREQFIKIRDKLWQEFSAEERAKVIPKLKELYETLRS